MLSFQGAFPLSGVQLARVREERGDDPTLQVAQEAGRLSSARLHAVLAHRRLWRPLPRLQPQQEADPLPLPQGRLITTETILGLSFQRQQRVIAAGWGLSVRLKSEICGR